MKSNMMTIIKKEFARFFGDKRMVISTLLVPGLMIYVMYTVMGEGLMDSFTAEEGYVATAYVQNLPEEFEGTFNSLPAEWTTVTTDNEVSDAQMAIEAKAADLLVVFPENFMAEVATYEVSSGKAAPNVDVFYNSASTESTNMYSIVVGIVDAFEASMTNKIDINASETKHDMATEKDMTGQLFSMLLPFLLMTFLNSACIAIAPESIAGEKERGTIATMLVTPMKRSALAWGKIISLSCIALLSGISSFIGTMLSLPKLMGGAASMDASVYGVTDYLMLLGIILSTVLVLVSLVSVVSAFAKSIKEAGTAITPITLVVMMVGILSMFGGSGDQSIGLFCIPIYNSVLSMQNIFSFTYSPVQVLVAMLVNIVVAGVLTVVLTKMFNNEKVMFSK